MVLNIKVIFFKKKAKKNKKLYRTLILPIRA